MVSLKLAEGYSKGSVEVLGARRVPTKGSRVRKVL